MLCHKSGKLLIGNGSRHNFIFARLHMLSYDKKNLVVFHNSLGMVLKRQRKKEITKIATWDGDSLLYKWVQEWIIPPPDITGRTPRECPRIWVKLPVSLLQGSSSICSAASLLAPGIEMLLHKTYIYKLQIGISGQSVLPDIRYPAEYPDNFTVICTVVEIIYIYIKIFYLAWRNNFYSNIERRRNLCSIYALEHGRRNLCSIYAREQHLFPNIEWRRNICSLKY